MEIVCVSPVANDLGESLCWDVEAARLYWIDAWKAKVYAFDPATRETRCTGTASALDGLIGGIKVGFHHLDHDQDRADPIAAVEADRPPTNRLSDGKCDRAGRCWRASANTDCRSPTGALRRLEPGRESVVMQDGPAGRLFAIHGLGARGLPEPRFGA